MNNVDKLFEEGSFICYCFLMHARVRIANEIQQLYDVG